MTGRVPRFWRRVYIHWCVFWLKTHKDNMMDQLGKTRARWSAMPAHMDDLKNDIDAITVEIMDLEQELI